MDKQGSDKEKLLEAIEDKFNLNELETIVFGLDINWENISGDTLSTKIISLLNYACRHELMGELKLRLSDHRPDVIWNEIDWLTICDQLPADKTEPGVIAGDVRGDVIGRDNVEGDQYKAGGDINFDEHHHHYAEGRPSAQDARWDRFKNRPLVFWSSVIASVFLFVFAAIGAVTDLNILPADTPTSSPKNTPVNTSTPIPTDTPTPTITPVPPTPRPIEPAVEGETLIIIGTFFEEENAEGFDVDGEIYAALLDGITELKLENVRVEVEPNVVISFSSTEQEEAAHLLGQPYDASLIIWGQVSKVRTNVNFLNVRQSELQASNVSLSETNISQVANPEAYARFVVDDLPGQMAYLSFFTLGQVRYNRGEFLKAIELINKGVSSIIGSQNVSDDLALAKAYFRLGWLYQSLNQTELSITNYEQAIELDPEYVSAFNNRGDAYMSTEQFELALADFDRAIELDPESANALNNRGNVHIIREQFDLALADYDRAIELNPESANAFTGRGLTYALKGKLGLAIADLDRAIMLAPGYANAFNGRGFAYELKGDLDLAIADYSQALEITIKGFDQATELNPQLLLAINNRAIAYLKLEEYDNAIADYDLAIEINDQDSRYFAIRGMVYGEKGLIDQSVSDFDRAIELNPENIEYYGLRGEAYAKKRLFDQSMADFDQGLNLDPQNISIHNSKCWYGSLLGESNSVLDNCEKAIELSSESDFQAAYRDSRGLALALTGDYEGAIIDFEIYAAYLKNHKGDETEINKRESWIANLENGINPFNDLVLDELLSN